MTILGLVRRLFDLVKAFGEVVERLKHRPVYEVESADGDGERHDPLPARSVQGKAAPISRSSFMRIFEQQRTRRAMIALFLAVLEMVRMQA